MTVDEVTKLVEAELRRVKDADSEMRIRALLVRAYPVARDCAGEQLASWTVAEDAGANTAVAYCEQGFDPRKPWGVVSLSGSNMGRESDWFRSLEGAVLEMKR